MPPRAIGSMIRKWATVRPQECATDRGQGAAGAQVADRPAAGWRRPGSRPPAAALRLRVAATVGGADGVEPRLPCRGVEIDQLLERRQGLGPPPISHRMASRNLAPPNSRASQARAERSSRLTVASEMLQRLRRFLQREPAEVALLQDPGSAFVDRFQSLERLVQLRDRIRPVIGEPRHFLERHRGSAQAALAAFRARAWSTSRCRMTREARPRKCPRSRRVTRGASTRLEVGFVDQRGGVQGAVEGFACRPG